MSCMLIASPRPLMAQPDGTMLEGKTVVLLVFLNGGVAKATRSR